MARRILLASNRVHLPNSEPILLGANSDGVLVLNPNTLAANTALTLASRSVLVGTPVNPSLTATSLILSDITASGDILIAVNNGGNSQAVLKAVGATGSLVIYNAGVAVLTTSVGTVTINATTLTFPAASSITTTVGALTLAPVSGSNLALTVAGAGTIAFTIGTGRFIINATTPEEFVHIFGNMRLGGSTGGSATSPYLDLFNAGQAAWRMGTTGSSFFIGNTGAVLTLSATVLAFQQATSVTTPAATNLTINPLTTGALILQSGGTEFLRLNNTGVGFYAVAPVARQTSGANLTNNVTAGGVNDTIANYTDLVTYSNDAAAIRNDIYQLARQLKQVNDGLRSYGLLT